MAISSYASYGEKSPIPNGINIKLELDKTEFFLGENILLHFCLENRGRESITFNTGHDYRGGNRSNRFKLTITDINGNILPDPDPGFNLGGIAGDNELKSGEQWCQSLPLFRYVRIDEAGLYQIKAQHDFGWIDDDKNNPLPVGKTKIKLNMPNEKQAKQVVKFVYSQSKKRPWESIGKKRKPYPDFSVLNYPIYLPIMYEKARQGDSDALAAIASTATLEATKVLLELSNHGNYEFALLALRAVSARFPDPTLVGKLAQRGMYGNVGAKLRQEFIDKTWRDEYKQDIRKHIRRLLDSVNMLDIMLGALIIESFGQVEDFPHLIGALNQAISNTIELERDTMVYPPKRGALNELLRAVEVLVKNEKSIPLQPKSDGEIVVYLTALGGEKFRPQGWTSYAKYWLTHDISFIREYTIVNLPDADNKAVKKELLNNLEHADIDILIAACNKSIEFEIKEAKDQILTVLKNANAPHLINCAVNASYKLGSKWATLNILVNRLEERAHYHDFIGRIKEFVIDTSTIGSGGNNGKFKPERLKREWIKFLARHQERLKNGRKFDFIDEEITPDLFPDVEWWLEAGGKWPSIEH